MLFSAGVHGARRASETNTMKELIARRDLAARIGLKTQTLARWAVEGFGPAVYRVGGRAMYSVDEVDRWLESRRAAVANSPQAA